MTNPISRRSVVCVTNRQVSSDFPDGQVVLMDVHEGTYYGLNRMGARIWEMIQSPRSVGDIVDTLLESYEVAEGRCLEEVSALLSDLASRSLVEITNGPD